MPDKTRTSSMVSLAFAGTTRIAVSAYVLLSGFRALSDDDFARVVIAQSFAAHPTWDPSGTSWLPFPFWLYGSILAVFGSSLAVARAVACLTGVLASCCVWLAGRWLGLSRHQCLLGAALTSTIAYAAWLGVATTPDLLNAALLVLAGASLARADLRIRLIGSIALFAATLSRYESWPVAVVWTAYATYDGARRRQSFWHWTLALLALAAPLAWMAHGITHHHDALFFVKRVVSYRRALGFTSTGALSQLWAAPKHLLLDAPELWLLVMLGSAISTMRHQRTWRRRWWRPAWSMVALLAFLVVGDMRDGAPTHHVGRTLLPVWILAGLLIAKPLSRLGRSPGISGAISALLVIVAFYGALIAPRPAWLGVDGFCTRAEETEAGMHAAYRVPKGQRLAVQAADYGYFAVQAAFARPDDTVILDRHDPRSPSKGDTTASSDALRQTLTQVRAEWLVAPRAWLPKLPAQASVRWQNPHWVLVRL